MERITAADYHRLATPEPPRVSPDGMAVAFVRRTPADDDRYEATVYLVSTTGGENARRFSLRDGEDSDPRWSPAGDRLAFASTRGADDDRQQLWIVPVDGGEGLQVTEVVGGVSEIAWSPDGTKVAFVQSVSEADRREDNDLRVPVDDEREDPDPRVIDRTVYRSMQRYTDGRRSQLYTVDLDATRDGPTADAVTRITTGESEVTSPTWLDDRTLLYADRWVGSDPDDSLEFDVVRHDLETADARRLHRSTAWSPTIAVSPDGRVAIPFIEPHRASMQPTELDVYDPENGEVVRVTGELDRTVDLAIAPEWGPGGRLYFATPDEGRITVWSVDASDPGDIDRELREGTVAGMSLGTRGTADRVIAVTMSQWDHPGDVFVRVGDTVHRLTTLNEDYLADRLVAEPEPVAFESDGQRVEGWVLTPPNAGADDAHPLVVEVHGGPHAMWTTAGTMWHEFQTLASRGYVVFWSNPRGSAGYGTSFMKAIDRDWGLVTLADIEAGIDAVVERPDVDEETVFLTGGSFGGFMTGWAVGSTDRFTAAVAQRGVYDLTGFYGTTDWAYKLVEGDFGTTPWENPSFLWEQSPAGRADRVTTPTLVIHSDVDFRTPAGTAELFYRILRKHDVDSRMVRYPREGHELSRSGEPAHVVDRIERIVRWFDGYSPSHDVPRALDRPDDADLSGSVDESGDCE